MDGAPHSFAGYVPGLDLRAVADRAALRAELGYGDELLCLVAVGGSGVGTPPLRRVIEALPLARERAPGRAQSRDNLHISSGRRSADLFGVIRLQASGYVPEGGRVDQS